MGLLWLWLEKFLYEVVVTVVGNFSGYLLYAFCHMTLAHFIVRLWLDFKHYSNTPNLQRRRRRRWRWWWQSPTTDCLNRWTCYFLNSNKEPNRFHNFWAIEWQAGETVKENAFNKIFNGNENDSTIRKCFDEDKDRDRRHFEHLWQLVIIWLKSLVTQISFRFVYSLYSSMSFVHLYLWSVLNFRCWWSLLLPTF